MGGLFKKMPITATTFAIGTLALIAFPLTSGFWSKEHILEEAYKTGHMFPHWIGIGVACLTPFYMTRLFIVAFCGKGRSKNADHAGEVNLVMLLPLLALAAMSLVSVYLHIPEYLKSTGHTAHLKDFHLSTTSIASLVALVVGAGLAALWYFGKDKDPIQIPLLQNKFYIDERYQNIVNTFQDSVGRILDIAERYLITPLARFPAACAISAGSVLRLFQVGNLQTYAFYFGVAVLLLIIILIF